MQDGTLRVRRCKPNKYHIQIITTSSFARKHCSWLISNRNSAKQLTNLAVACEYPHSGGEQKSMWLRVCQRPDVGRVKSCGRPPGSCISSYTLAHARPRGAAIINNNANNNNVNTSGDARD
jgi:hypothetical protein